MSPADDPITISICDEVFVKSLLSWHSICALVKRILASGSSFCFDPRSSHWNARLMFANAKRPSGFRSRSLFVDDSCVMTRETNEELLLTMLFFGFRLFGPSFTGRAASAGLPSPNAGAATCSFEMNVGVLVWPTLINDNFTPTVGGVGTVARGLLLTIGASDGCGGGVARWRLSFRWYVPAWYRY